MQVLELKQLAVVLLEAMCEETNQGTEKLVKGIYKAIDIAALKEVLVYFYKLSKDEYMVGNYSEYSLKLIHVYLIENKRKR